MLLYQVALNYLHSSFDHSQKLHNTPKNGEGVGDCINPRGDASARGLEAPAQGMHFSTVNITAERS